MAIDMAKSKLKCLEMETSGSCSCDDAISRKAVLDLVNADWKYEGLETDVASLPPVTLQPCDDAISRKSIKQKLQEQHDFFVNAYGGFSNLSQNGKSRVYEITNCISMVVNEPPVTPQQKYGEWIPVSERLPEDKTYVLTTIKVPNRIAHARSSWYEGGFFHNDNGDTWRATDMEVKAWMPLPEPYDPQERSE